MIHKNKGVADGAKKRIDQHDQLIKKLQNSVLEIVNINKKVQILVSPNILIFAFFSIVTATIILLFTYNFVSSNNNLIQSKAAINNRSMMSK